MALIDRKIKDWSQAVSSLDDKPKMTAAALKAAFDSNSNQLKPAINGIIDDLTGSQGALNIGLTPIDGLSGNNVQTVLQAISLLLKSSDVDISNLERLFTADGASLVGLQPVSGVSASNLQQAIISLADTISKIDPYLGNPVAISQGGTGAKTAQEAIYNLGCMPRENLLDNAYFIGGGTDGNFPINPKGLTEYSGLYNRAYAITRWFSNTQWGQVYINLNLSNDGMIISSSPIPDTPQAYAVLWQIVPHLKSLVGKTVTFSIYAADINSSDSGNYPQLIIGNEQAQDLGSVSVEKSDDITSFTFEVKAGQSAVGIRHFAGTSKSSSLKVIAMKLEIGDKQTLGWKDKQGQIHLFEIPDYHVAYLKCRYYSRVYGTGLSGIWYDESSIFISIPFEQKMRINPSLKLLKSNLTVSTLGEGDQTATNATIDNPLLCTNGGIAFALIKGFTGGLIGKTVSFQTENLLEVNAEI